MRGSALRSLEPQREPGPDLRPQIEGREGSGIEIRFSQSPELCKVVGSEIDRRLWIMRTTRSRFCPALRSRDPMSVRRTLLLCVFLLAAAAPAQAQSCHVPRFIFCAGCATDVSIGVRRNATCTIRYWTGSGRVFSQRMVVRPRGGIYGTANVTLGAYRANPGFVGSDHFEVRIEWETHGKRTFTTLRVNVTVSDKI
jgi:hypothetical protein